MEGFTYVNIFATKGVEYLLVISVLLLFIPFWRMVSSPAKSSSQATAWSVPALSEWFQLPEEKIYYHQGHSWAMPETGNIVKVGMDDFAQKLVGKIDGVQLPKVGSRVTQGEKGWSLLAGPKSTDMLSPVDGEIIAINESLLSPPETIGHDPYGKSWLLKVQAPKITANLKNLLSGDLARKWMEGVRESLLARMNYNLGTVSQDGGVLVEGIARNIDQERWDEIAKEFFLST
ncbi:MAG: glycine cleavage system protein H, partial [Syntrophales bacterium LBB04]|nr:glycine cleavage system protein H [Syntrophales bacterium LBB04]